MSRQRIVTRIAGPGTPEPLEILEPGCKLRRLSNRQRETAAMSTRTKTLAFGPLIAACRGLSPIPTAVVCPVDTHSLEGAMQAGTAGLIEPVLVGPERAIRAAAEAANTRLGRTRIVDAGDDVTAAAAAVAMARDGRVGALMKGRLHTDTLLARVLDRAAGLRTGRRLSHVFVIDPPGFGRLLHVSDAALNIAPDLPTRIDITVNAIELARACGAEPPKVAILSAVETVNPAIPSTLDAAAIAKMAERGQIQGAVVDGPLAMDNAVDAGAARVKGIRSLVAGHADVLIAPSIEASNMVVKTLTYVAGACAAGIVVGGLVPVMLTSRADGARARLASSALALLLAEYRRTGRSRLRGRRTGV